MTNEQYLEVSYFVAAAAGVIVAAGTAMFLARPNYLATAGAALHKLGVILRRLLPTWLLLAVLLGFMSVSYMDCSHHTYGEVVADRPHMIATSKEHAHRMLLFAAVALTVYGFVLGAFLLARARSIRLSGKGGRPPAD